MVKLMDFDLVAGTFQFQGGIYREFILPWSFFMQILKAC